jgi:hypothetical protein
LLRVGLPSVRLGPANNFFNNFEQVFALELPIRSYHMTISTKQAKELHLQGQHELSTELFLRGYDISTLPQEGIDLVVTHVPSQVQRGLHVQTSRAAINRSAGMAEYTLSKKLILEKSSIELWFALVLVQSEIFQFVMVPREEMVRFLQRQERLCPTETENVSFQLFFGRRGGVSSRGYSFTPFLGLQTSFPPVCRAA